jgi:hypothetical protein
MRLLVITFQQIGLLCVNFNFVCKGLHSDRMTLWSYICLLSGSGNWYWWILWTEIYHWLYSETFYRLTQIAVLLVLLQRHAGLWRFGVLMQLTHLQLNSLQIKIFFSLLWLLSGECSSLVQILSNLIYRNQQIHTSDDCLCYWCCSSK